jgi:hypothetical protein
MEKTMPDLHEDEVDTLRLTEPPVVARLVEYETIIGWDKNAAPTPVWESRKALVFTQVEADGMATSALYCRNKRVTPLTRADASGVREDGNG